MGVAAHAADAGDLLNGGAFMTAATWHDEMAIPSSLKQRLVRLRDRMPLPCQRLVNRLAFHCLLPAAERRMWDRRLADVTACRDNAYLPRHPDAGRVRGGVMTMHNGLRLHAGSYYGWGSQRILERNRGCHEPQEERVFAQVLDTLPPGAVMIELGAYWAFYSLWFASQVAGAQNWMVEPEPGNLEKGKANFALNGRQGNFVCALVGAEHRPQDDPPHVSVDGLMKQHGIERVHLLHSDIQGWELDMLRGAAKAFDERRVDHVFISTHSNELHRACADWLRQKDYRVHQDIDLDATFSHDGLITAHSPDLDDLEPLQLDRRRPASTA